MVSLNGALHLQTAFEYTYRRVNIGVKSHIYWIKICYLLFSFAGACALYLKCLACLQLELIWIHLLVFSIEGAYPFEAGPGDAGVLAGAVDVGY